MFTQKKGGKWHKKTGIIYYWSMVVVAISAVGLVLLSPFTNGRLFLTGIAVFSFYLCFTGKRALQQRNGTPLQWYDWGVLSLMGLVALAMIGYGSFQITRIATRGIFDATGILFIVFGFFSLANAHYDFKKYRLPSKARYAEKEWFFMHIIRMGGSYIATFTAFALVNIRYVFPNAPIAVYIATWIMPGVLGGLIISRVVRHYLTKFRMTR